MTYEDRLKKCHARVNELEASFDLYNKASMSLMRTYKLMHSEVPENTWPDAAKVNEWAAGIIESVYKEMNK